MERNKVFIHKGNLIKKKESDTCYGIFSDFLLIQNPFTIFSLPLSIFLCYTFLVHLYNRWPCHRTGS